MEVAKGKLLSTGIPYWAVIHPVETAPRDRLPLNNETFRGLEIAASRLSDRTGNFARLASNVGARFHA